MNWLELLRRAKAGDEDARRELRKAIGLTRRAAVSTRAKTLNAETRTVRAVIATEEPVPMLDEERWELVPEVLLASGLTLGRGRKQVPLLNSHNRSGVEDVLGTVRDLQAVDGGIDAELLFDDDERSLTAFNKVSSGSLTDLSAGYQVLKRVYVEEGKTKQVRGRAFTGPVNVVTKWLLREASVTPIGADAGALIRSDDGFAAETAPADDERPIEADDIRTAGGTAMRQKLMDGRELSLVEIEALRAAGQDVELDDRTVLKSTAPAEVVDMEADRARARADGQQAEQRRQADIRRWGGIARMDETEIRAAVDSNETADAARERFAKAAEARMPPAPVTVEVERDERETFVRAATDGLALRGGWRPPDGERPAPGSEQYRNASLQQIAQQCLIQRGMNPQKVMLLDKTRLMSLALGGRGERPRLIYQGPDRCDPDTLERDAGPFNHSTSDFPFILGDAMNRRLQAAFVETPATYGAISTPVSRADFRTNYVNRLSEGPNLEPVLENGEITQGALYEAQEEYALKTYGRIIGFTRNAIIDDNLGAFQRTPQIIGSAARRLLNRGVWARVKNGKTNLMGDGYAWFNAAVHKNLITGPGTALNATNLGIAKKQMRLQTGMQPLSDGGEANVLNIVPSLLAVPASLEDVATKLLADGYFPQTAADGVASWIRSLTLVVEPELENGDNGSATAWYLFADPRQYEVIELGLLNGVEAPTLMERQGSDILGIEFITYMDYGAQNIDWRPAFRNDGA